VKCKDIIVLNNLNRKAVIRIGQRLKIPGGVQKYRITNIVKNSIVLRQALAGSSSSASLSVSGADKPETKAASKAETSQSSEQSQSQALAINNDGSQATLPKQTPTSEPVNNSTSVVNADSDSAQPQEHIGNLDTRVHSRGERYWVIVLPSESLGLYADWLSIGTTRQLRSMNKLKGRAEVDVNQRIYLPIITAEQKRQFLLARDEYHLNIQLQYFQRFKIVNTRKQRLRKGQTLWSIARKNNIPLWLLMQLNKQVQIGSIIEIPEVVVK